MYYVITNKRIGNLGDVYKPKPGINVEALLWAGFIAQVDDGTTDEVSTTEAPKGAKTKKATKKD